jgi:CheY-like chemotaxis protein
MDTRRGAVLIVDDEPSVRQVLQLLCERLGLRTLATGSGYEAIHLYEQHRAHIRLVLLDVNMPLIDGPSTLARLRSAGLDARIGFMSANTGRYTAEGLLALGADRFFEKPFHFETFGRELLSLVEDVRVAA